MRLLSVLVSDSDRDGVEPEASETAVCCLPCQLGVRDLLLT